MADKLKVIEKEATELLAKIVDKPDLEVTQDDEVFHVSIKTEEDAPIVIGRHGETIKAIQKILEVILYKKFNESVDVLVNVNDYREKQKERLVELAERFAKKTQEEGRSSYLRGLSAYERKLIHEYIGTNYPDLASYSEGEGRDRKLVVDLKENAPASDEKEE